MNYFNPFQQNYDNMYSYNTVPQVVKVNGYNAGTNPFCHQTTTPTTTG